MARWIAAGLLAGAMLSSAGDGYCSQCRTQECTRQTEYGYRCTCVNLTDRRTGQCVPNQ